MPTQSVFPTLELARDLLAGLAGVQTCKIGLESNMTPADYPMVRIVPSTIGDGPMIGERGVECLIYFGQPIHEFTAGAESQWEELLAMEPVLIDALGSAQGFAFTYKGTVLDEDRSDAYKLLAIRCTIEA